MAMVAHRHTILPVGHSLLASTTGQDFVDFRSRLSTVHASSFEQPVDKSIRRTWLDKFTMDGRIECDGHFRCNHSFVGSFEDAYPWQTAKLILHDHGDAVSTRHET